MAPLELADAAGFAAFVMILAVLWFRSQASENPDYFQWYDILWAELRAPLHGPDPAHGYWSRWWLCVRATVALGLTRPGPDMYMHEMASWGRRVASLHAGHRMTDWGAGVGYQELRVSGWRYIVYAEPPC